MTDQMRIYDYIWVNTVEDANTFLMGMSVFIGGDEEEWTVEAIDTDHERDGYVITVYKD